MRSGFAAMGVAPVLGELCAMQSLEVSRRAFVVGAATIAAVAGSVAAAAADPPKVAPGAEDTVPYEFDRDSFAALLNRPFEHRQCFTARSFADAADMLNLMRNSIEAYVDPRYFAGGPNALHAAAVFYHGDSVLLALDDAAFAKYPLAAGIVQFAKGKPGIDKGAVVNPGAARLRALADEHDATFMVCNNALSGMSGWIAEQVAPAGQSVTRENVVAIHDELVTHFLPGVVLVPAGVAAINAAQEARFTLLQN